MKQFISIFLLVFLFQISFFNVLYAQSTLFVSRNGNDKNIGSIDKPLQSIEKAIFLIKNSADKHFDILIREGTYYLKEPIQIDVHDFKNKTIVISGYQNETPIISGGERIHPIWKRVLGKPFFKTKIKETNVDYIFLNGEKKILARYPNYKKDVLMNGTAEDVLSIHRIRSWKNPKGAYIHALHGREWGSVHYLVKEKKGDSLVYNGGFQNNRPSKMHPIFRYIENVFEELDAPGEWFLDKGKQELYYYPNQDEDLNNALTEISKLKSLIKLRGTSENPIKNISIRNIIFTHTNRTVMDKYEPLMRSDWSIHRGGAIFMENAEDCSIENCEFRDLGGNAIFLSKYAYNCTIKGNYIHNIGASAISLVGDSSCLRSPSFKYSQFVPLHDIDKIPGAKNNLYPRQCTVEDNLICNIGELEKQVAGIQIQVASQLNIKHNTIYKVPRSAINIGDGAFGGHVIEYNDAFKTVLETSDHGAFNSWGRDRFWHPNYQTLDTLTTMFPELILLDALYTTIIRNNRFRCDHGWDIDLDDGSSNYHIYNNLCLSGGIKLREGFYRIVENNIFVNNTLHPHVWFKNSHDVIQRNIIMTSYHPIRLQGWGRKIDYNFFQSEESLKKVRKWGIDENSIAGDLLFRDPENSDFTIVGTPKAFLIGFENFPMNRFGVYSKQLKKIAEQPEIPILVMNNSSDVLKVFNWFDGDVRAVNGMGDRSAYGLPDETGVVVVKLKQNGILEESGIKSGDVIRSINDRNVKDTHDLFTITNDEKRRNNVLKVILFRNQEEIERAVLLKR